MCGPGPIIFIKDLNSAQEAWKALKSHYNLKNFSFEAMKSIEIKNNNHNIYTLYIYI
jgi:hypothetical protein